MEEKIMLIKANAKINWALDVTGIREDGYHLLDMIMQKIDLFDVIEILPCSELSLRIDGNDELSSGEDNLVMRAARILDPDGIHGAAIRLEKHIPQGAGLGGGSADAAAVLKALNGYWQIGLSDRQLSVLGLRLGADIPYCLTDSPARVQGIGEKIIPFSVPCSFPVIIAMPDSRISTKEVYAAWSSTPQIHPPISAIISQMENGSFYDTSSDTINALYPPAVLMCDEIGNIRQMLMKYGAAMAEMTGSGSAVYGVFVNEEIAEKAYGEMKNRVPFCVLTHTCI